MHRVRSRQVGTGFLVGGTMRLAWPGLLCAALVLAGDPAGAQEWAQFRGPGAAGVVADTSARVMRALAECGCAINNGYMQLRLRRWP